ncbi:MAG: hypothetical protein KQH79_07480 [Bacteroidetes bacterium]|nr:hypothetical protein [Bacteroidota bacterium]
MKKVLKLTGIAIVLATFTLFTACNQEAKKEEKTNASLQELKKEMNDISIAIDKLKQSESEFKQQAQVVLDDFSQQMEEFEMNLKASGEEIDQKTQQNITDLKNAEKELQNKLDMLNDEQNENLAEFKEEVKHDFSKFGRSVKAFFNDDI